MNERHPIRHCFTNRRIQDEYAMKKGTPYTDFHEDNRHIWRVRCEESKDSAQLQPGPMDDRRGQVPLDFTKCSIPREGEKTERLKIFTDGSLKDERVGYAIVTSIVTPKTTIKNQVKS
jgi:hypothetical protein